MDGQSEILQGFLAAVDAEMTARYGITWAEACGDREPLLAAIQRGLNATDFVRRWGEKYDLVPRELWSRGRMVRAAVELAASGGPNVFSVIPHVLTRVVDAPDDE